MRIAAAGIVVSVMALLSGCVSWLASEKATDSAEGIRYSLPQPFLLVTPKPDGTLDVEQVLLPDTSQTYTIRQPSFIASHTLNVELDNQMLKAVDLSADTGVVPGKAIEAYGDYRKAAIEAEAAQAKTEQEKSAAAKKRVADAELAVAKANAVVEYLEPNKADVLVAPEYLKAQVALQQAEAELDAAQDAARELGIEGFNVPKTGTTPAPTAYGPVLYRIKQIVCAEVRKVSPAATDPPQCADKNTQYAIQLVATLFEGKQQPELDTSKIALPPEDKPAKFALDPEADISSGNNTVLVTSTTLKVAEIDPDPARRSIHETDGTELSQEPIITKFSNGRKLKIGFPKKLPAGEYVVTMSLKVGTDKDFTSYDFTVIRQ